MKGNDIRLPAQRLKGAVPGKGLYSLLFRGAAGQDPAAEAAQDPDEGLPDLTGPHNAHGHPAKLPAADICQRIVLAKITVQDRLDHPDRHEHGHNGIFRHGMGRIAHVGNGDSQGFRVLPVDVLKAHGARGDGLYPEAVPDIDQLPADGRGDGIHGVAAFREKRRFLIGGKLGQQKLRAVLSGVFFKECLLVGTAAVYGNLHVKRLLSALKDYVDYTCFRRESQVIQRGRGRGLVRAEDLC